MHKGFLTLGALFGALSVALGAFAAHGLKKIFDANQLQTFETAVRYQFYHVFALIIAAILFQSFPGKAMLWACRFFVAGIIIFSGSLYALTYTQYAGLDQFRWLGMVTPFGGVSLIAGWCCMTWAVYKKP